MIRLLAHPSPSLSRHQVVSRSQSFCVWQVELTDKRVEGGGVRGAKSYNLEKARPSINHPMISGSGCVYVSRWRLGLRKRWMLRWQYSILRMCWATILNLLIPIKDLAKPHSRISTKYLTIGITMFSLELWCSEEKYSTRCSCQHREQHISKRNNEIYSSNHTEEIYISRIKTTKLVRWMCYLFGNWDWGLVTYYFLLGS